MAALTFDEEYQKKRREQQHTQPASVQESIAQSGKGLVMVIVFFCKFNFRVFLVISIFTTVNNNLTWQLKNF